MKRIENPRTLPAERTVSQQIAELRKQQAVQPYVEEPQAQYRGEIKSVDRNLLPKPARELQPAVVKAELAVRSQPPVPSIYDVSYNTVHEEPAPVEPIYREPIDIFKGTEGEINVPFVLLAILITLMAFPWVGAFLNFMARGGQPWVPGMN